MYECDVCNYVCDCRDGVVGGEHQLLEQGRREQELVRPPSIMIVLNTMDGWMIGVV